MRRKTNLTPNGEYSYYIDDHGQQCWDGDCVWVYGVGYGIMLIHSELTF